MCEQEMPPDLTDGDIDELMVLGCCLPWGVPEIEEGEEND